MATTRTHHLSRHGGVLALIIAAGLLAHGSLAGQDSQTADAVLRQQVLVTPSPTAPIRSGAPSIFLSGSTSKTEASVEGGFRVLDDPNFGNISATVGLTAPLSQDDETVLGDLDGLSGGTRLSLSLTGLHWPWDADDAENTSWCQAKVAAKRIPEGTDCDAFDLTPIVEHDPALEREYYTEVDASVPVLYEIAASLMPEEMKYLETTTLEPGTRQGTSASLGLSIGRFFGSQLLAIGYRHQIAFEQSPETEVCTPLGTAGALRCRKARLGEPMRAESGVGSVQARGFIRRNLAWNPRLTYRLSDSEWAVELPFYFVPNEEGLIGGMAPSYSEDGGWAVRVFVGKAFRTGL